MDCTVIQRSCTAQPALQVIARSPVVARENVEAPRPRSKASAWPWGHPEAVGEGWPGRP